MSKMRDKNEGHTTGTHFQKCVPVVCPQLIQRFDVDYDAADLRHFFSESIFD
jgi:hypothetical protein